MPLESVLECGCSLSGLEFTSYCVQNMQNLQMKKPTSYILVAVPSTSKSPSCLPLSFENDTNGFPSMKKDASCTCGYSQKVL